MRDPKRIERIGRKLIRVWKKYPDWRLGQLVSNMMGAGQRDVFYPEDDKWERWFDEALGVQHVERAVYVGPMPDWNFETAERVEGRMNWKRGSNVELAVDEVDR